MKKLKLVIVLLLIASFSAQFGGVAYADSVNWTLTDGELYITGTGAIPDYSNEKPPWRAKENYPKDITQITVGNGITRVGNQAFQYCSHAVSASISDSVDTIGESAFYGCARLETIKLPQHLNEIGKSAFANCSALKSIVIPERVKTITESAFISCRELEQVVIPLSVAEIKDSAFHACVNLKTVYYEGSSADWDRVKVAGWNKNLTSAEFRFGTDVTPSARDISDTRITITDIVSCYDDSECLVALMSDGTVMTAGLEKHFDDEVTNMIKGWDELTQITSTGYQLFGLKKNGTVVSTVRSNQASYAGDQLGSDPNSWSNVKVLEAGDYECYGLTNDGTVLFFNGDAQGVNYSGVEKICWFAYPESRGIFCLKSDGTIILPKEYYSFEKEPKNIVDIDSSGYVSACLSADGRVYVTGLAALYYQNDMKHNIEKLNNVEQIIATGRGVVCRLQNGRVISCGDDVEPLVSNGNEWRSIVDIQDMGVVVGLGSDGKIKFPDGDYSDVIKPVVEAASEWNGIVRIKAYNGYGYMTPYLLGWKSDGTLCAAGIKLGYLD